MWLFKKKDSSSMQQRLQASFDHVREDTKNLTQWVQYLNQKNQEQQDQIVKLHQKIQPSPASPLTSQHYHYLRQRIDHLSQKVDFLIDKNQNHAQTLSQQSEKLDLFHQRLSGLESQKMKPKQSFKEKVVQTLSRHSKSYLKNLILNYLQQHQKISALQLKDIVVDQQGLASKSSFYRILEEIEKEDYVTVIKDGKQKIFLLKSAIIR